MRSASEEEPLPELDIVVTDDDNGRGEYWEHNGQGSVLGFGPIWEGVGFLWGRGGPAWADPMWRSRLNRPISTLHMGWI